MLVVACERGLVAVSYERAWVTAGLLLALAAVLLLAYLAR